MTPDDRSEIHAAIVEELQDGRATTGFLAENIDYSKPHLNTQLQILQATGEIRTIHEPTALHELSDGSHPPSESDIESDTLSAPEAAIVEELQDGRATTGYLVDEIDYSRSHINTHLRLLLAKEIIHKVHPPTALYELVDTPRKTTPDGDNTEDEPINTADADSADTHDTQTNGPSTLDET